jgi:hypothetical protein
VVSYFLITTLCLAAFYYANTLFLMGISFSIYAHFFRKATRRKTSVCCTEQSKINLQICVLILRYFVNTVLLSTTTNFKWSLSFTFTTENLYSFFVSCMYITCAAQLIFVNLSRKQLQCQLQILQLLLTKVLANRAVGSYNRHVPLLFRLWVTLTLVSATSLHR